MELQESKVGSSYQVENTEAEKPQKFSSSSRWIIAIVILLLLIGLAVGLYLAFGYTEPRPLLPPRRNGIIFSCPRMPQQAKEYDAETCKVKSGCEWRVYNKNDAVNISCVMSAADTSPWTISEKTQSTDQQAFTLSASGQSILGQSSVSKLKVKAVCVTDKQLRIKVTDANSERYEVPQSALPINDSITSSCSEAEYTVTTSEEAGVMSILVEHLNTSVLEMKFDGGFVYTDQFLQIGLSLNSSTLYGLGEHNHRQFKLDMNYTTWAIFTRDVAPVDFWNLYGAHPFFLNLINDNSSMGVFLKNSNAMDVQLQPDPYPSVTYRVIGGVLDFHIFFSSSPEGIVKEYTSLIGRPPMPPYWSLGFQLSKWNYSDLATVTQVVDRNMAAGIPLDVVYGDIDYMHKRLDFTYDIDAFAGLPEYVDELKEKDIRYIIILDPGIGNKHDNGSKFDELFGGTYKALDDGLAEDIFIRAANGSLLLGEVWPGSVYFPDYTHENVTRWWRNQIWDFYNNSRRVNESGIHFDALWVDMNEVANFKDNEDARNECPINKWNAPPYVPENLRGGLLVDKTICMDSEQNWGRHYDVHSLYGHSMAMVTHNALQELFPEKRPLVLSRSTFPGTGKYAAHWLGDNQSQWRQMPWSIVGMLEFSLFGFAMTGSDICGFWFAADEEMCQRWMQVGAFYPFARNHNADRFPHQDPAAYSDDMIQSSRSVLLTRYKLLPYLYTLFYEAHTTGSTVARPLVNEFHMDEMTHGVDRQFLWGSALLISPALEKGQTEVNAYIPAGVWYDYYSFKPIETSQSMHTFFTPLNKINLHVRGGYVIPWQTPDVNTAKSRNKTFGLLVALDLAGEAEGKLFYDDGESADSLASKKYLLVRYLVKGKKLSITIEESGYAPATRLQIERIEILGVRHRVDYVHIGGETDIEYSLIDQSLTIQSNITYNQNHTIEWGVM